MTCEQCGGTMSPKQTPTGRRVFECNQDNGDCLNDRGYPTSKWPVGPPRQKNVQRNAQGQSSGMSKDDYWQRKEQRDIEKDPVIIRQHSQEMALRLAAIYPGIISKQGEGAALSEPDMKKLRWFIDWFVSDTQRPVIGKPISQNTSRHFDQADPNEQPGAPYSEEDSI